MGSGKGYVVTVSRPDRRIGQKTPPLGAGCDWSDTSRPGAGKVTYTLRESGQQTVAAKLTLNVPVEPSLTYQEGESMQADFMSQGHRP